MNRQGSTLYYNADGLGSVTSLDDAGANQTVTYQYDAFGKSTGTTGSLFNPFRYTGREWDQETGLYYYRARYYDPSTGRFLSEDRLRFQGEYNFYRYVSNNPLSWIDPSGDKRCFAVTPNGMKEIPCADPGGAMNCIYVWGGISCSVPVSPNPFPEPSMGELIDCYTKKIREGDRIVSEAQEKYDRKLGRVGGTSMTLTVVEQVLEQGGATAASEWVPAVHLVLIPRDIYEMLEIDREAQEKLRKVSECKCHN